MNNMGRLIVYSGPSGVGKGTLLKPLLTPNGALTLSVSATTRAPREGEKNGREYHFVSREQFLKMIDADEMLEYAEYNGNYYGTPLCFVNEQRRLGNDVVLEIETKGAMQIKRLCPDAVMIFIMPPSYKALEERLVGRATETEQQRQGRLRAAIGEIEMAYEYDFVIVNDDIEVARCQLSAAINAGGLLTRLNKNMINEVLENAKTCNE